MKIDASDVSRLVINNMADAYDLITLDPWITVDKNWEAVFIRFMRDLATFCKLSGYIPEGLTAADLDEVELGRVTQNLGKLMLIDVIVTRGLNNLHRPMDVQKVYRLAYDRKYIFIPPEQRPKEDFMNKPV